MSAPRRNDRRFRALPCFVALCLMLAGASPAAADTLTLTHQAEYPASAPSTERLEASGVVDQEIPPGSSMAVFVFTEDLERAPYSACAATYNEELARTSPPSMAHDPFKDPAGYEASSPVRGRWSGPIQFTDYTARSGPYQTSGGSLDGGQFWAPARYRLCGYLTVGNDQQTRATATGEISVVGTVAEQCKVPRVLGLTLAKAKTKLLDAGCRLGSVAKKHSRKKKNTVISQSPKAGKAQKAGTKIDVVLSRGAKAKS